MNNKKCLYCYKVLDENTTGDFHEQCSLDFFGTKQQPLFEHSLKQMVELAKNVVERSIAVPGVQPKLSLSLIDDTIQEGNKGRLTVVGALGGNYIFKPPSDHFPEMPENEHLTMRIAEAFGINVVKSSLIRLQSGELSYITKRIDRTDSGEKTHMLDMFQITEAFDKYKSSMEKIGKALNEYSDNTLLDKVYFLELAIFSFLTGNNDMHLKNFSMINIGDKWTLAPAYDLLNVAIVNPDDTEELALTLEGKKKKIKWENFERLGKMLELNDKQIGSIKKRFLMNKNIAIQWIDKSFLSEEYKEKYRALLEDRYIILLQ
ncbi:MULTISPECIES: HipA domain-containing protein [Flavobacterium]|uniref:Phosphatidylinositol kinase n=2 Tax=Flavobacterium TaxID=237 RepID=A0A0D0F113_9FLAO|nr:MULTISPECIES: HipA domain-containing protein [Flavobacterium]KIO51637.1 phosphatidylinositol kinase [Flavobacterium hibernum]MCC9063702.1 HipA domain-containing protein [Flavobacterium sp. F-30]OXA85252.1 phosphatidylinositol kinase [Flavobacterium hibernum]